MAFSYILPNNENDKYFLAAQTKISEAIQCTIKWGYPSPLQIKEDIKRVIKNLDWIISTNRIYVSKTAKVEQKKET